MSFCAAFIKISGRIIDYKYSNLGGIFNDGKCFTWYFKGENLKRF